MGCIIIFLIFINYLVVFKWSNQAAEAQEALEKESLTKVESEVREELSPTLNGGEVSS